MSSFSKKKKKKLSGLSDFHYILPPLTKPLSETDVFYHPISLMKSSNSQIVLVSGKEIETYDSVCLTKANS